MAIEEGKPAPQFTLNDKDGNKVALKDLKGQNVVVYFYPRDDTLDEHFRQSRTRKRSSDDYARLHRQPHCAASAARGVPQFGTLKAPGCTKEACGFRDLWDEVQNTGTVILGISPDGAEKHQKFADKYDLPFTLLCDPDKKIMGKYDAFGEKMMYGKKTQGVIRSTVWIGPNGRIVKHWRRVAKAADHPAKVLDALREA